MRQRRILSCVHPCCQFQARDRGTSRGPPPFTAFPSCSTLRGWVWFLGVSQASNSNLCNPSSARKRLLSCLQREPPPSASWSWAKPEPATTQQPLGQYPDCGDHGPQKAAASKFPPAAPETKRKRQPDHYPRKEPRDTHPTA